jgi:esterase/lipase superfamily enzyme
MKYYLNILCIFWMMALSLSLSAKNVTATEDTPMVTVLYGTDRALIPTRKGAMFEGVSGGKVLYGKATVLLDVTYPRKSQKSVTWLNFTTSRGKHTTDFQREELEPKAFNAALSGQEDTFVFIHGFNTSFREGIFRAAQLAYDLQLPGTPVIYSWPSAGALGDFDRDLRTVEDQETILHCTAFIEQVLRTSKGRKVHLVAHSMGTRLLCSALEKLNGFYASKIKSVVLISAEIDAAEFTRRFEGKGGLKEKFADKGCPFLIYASSEDLALKAAYHKSHSPRLGQAGEYLTLLDGITVVDSSRISKDCGLCHGWDDRDGIIDDLVLFVREGLPPQKRLLTPQSKGKNTYYEIFDGVHRIKRWNDYDWALAFRAGALTNEARMAFFASHPVQLWVCTRNSFYPNALDVRIEPYRHHWRPCFETGFAFMRSRGEGPSVSTGMVRFALGFQYVWKNGWGFGFDLDSVSQVWKKGNLEEDRILRRLINDGGFPKNQVHLQLTRYFSTGL